MSGKPLTQSTAQAQNFKRDDLFLLGTLEAGHARGGGQWSVCAVRADTGSGGPYAG